MLRSPLVSCGAASNIAPNAAEIDPHSARIFERPTDVRPIGVSVRPPPLLLSLYIIHNTGDMRYRVIYVKGFPLSTTTVITAFSNGDWAQFRAPLAPDVI